MKTCENCGNEHNGAYGSGRFCSIKCSRGFSTKSKRKEINEKVSSVMKGRGNGNVKLSCKICESSFEVGWNKRSQMFCSRSCSTIWKNTHLGICTRGGLASAAKRVLRSKNEIMFFDLCNNYFQNVQHNVRMFNGWDADIILVNEKIAILWNGKWHYEKITKRHSLSQVKNRDKIKIKEIQKNNYIPYIIKDMGGYNPDFVNSEFKKFLKYLSN